MLAYASVFAALSLSGTARAGVRHAASSCGCGDVAILRLAAVRYAHSSALPILDFLRTRPQVREAALGRDGSSIDIEFRDGLHSMLLARQTSSATAAPVRLSVPSRFTSSLQVLQRRALVLEPFVTQLGLGADAGSLEAEALRAAGLTVDTLYNSAVTVDVMASLSQYNVVYINTHAGVNQYGEGVVVTGQVYNPSDISLKPLTDERSVFVAGIAGSPLQYYGIVSGYVHKYETQFPTNALVFVNGCDMLRASLFWDALRSKGVGAMPSWDHEVLPGAAQTAAIVFLRALAQGETVEQASTAVFSGGFGTSTVPGEVPARFGYLGNGLVRLDGSADVPATPTPLPVTPTATSQPTVVATPAAISTSITVAPLTTVPTPMANVVRSVSLWPAVLPGSRQMVRVTGSPLSAVKVSVHYPNGALRSARMRIGARGSAVFAYRQPGNRITRYSRTATVTVSYGDNGKTVQIIKRSYEIRFRSIDLVVTSPVNRAAAKMSFWIHTHGGGLVELSVRGPGTIRTKSRQRLSPGWQKATLRLNSGQGEPRGSGVVAAFLQSGSRVYRAQAPYDLR